MTVIAAPTVCIVSSHPGPATHLADISKELNSKNVVCYVFAVETAFDKFKEKDIKAEKFYDSSQPFHELAESQIDLLAQKVAALCSESKYVIVDVGSLFSAKVLESLSLNHPNICRVAYYDNPENHVAGGYSKTARSVISFADTIVFANSNLENTAIYDDDRKVIDFEGKKRFGLGYSSLPTKISKIKALRDDKSKKDEIREKFFEKTGLMDNGQKICCYLGGANEAYHNIGFPKYLKLLKDLIEKETLFANVIIAIQQHPRSKREGDLDGKLFNEWKLSLGHRADNIILSPISTDEALIISDVATYFQTTTNADAALCMPTFQIGNNDKDTLVKKGVCQSVNTADEFEQIFSNSLKIKTPYEPETDLIFESLGIKKDWRETLLKIFLSD